MAGPTPAVCHSSVRAATHEARVGAEGERGTACEDFTSLWEALSACEQARLVHLVVERVDYDGLQGKITITFHSDASNVLAEQLAKQQVAGVEFVLVADLAGVEDIAQELAAGGCA